MNFMSAYTIGSSQYSVEASCSWYEACWLCIHSNVAGRCYTLTL